MACRIIKNLYLYKHTDYLWRGCLSRHVAVLVSRAMIAPNVSVTVVTLPVTCLSMSIEFLKRNNVD